MKCEEKRLVEAACPSLGCTSKPRRAHAHVIQHAASACHVFFWRPHTSPPLLASPVAKVSSVDCPENSQPVIGEDRTQPFVHVRCQGLTPGAWPRRRGWSHRRGIGVTPRGPVRGGAASSRPGPSSAILVFLLDLQPASPPVRPRRAEDAVPRFSLPRARWKARQPRSCPGDEPQRLAQTRAGPGPGGRVRLPPPHAARL